MTYGTDSQITRYLPVAAGGRVVAIPMRDVIAVRQITGGTGRLPALPTLDADSDHDGRAPIIDLARLLGSSAAPSSGQPHAVIVSAPAGAGALRVDTVYPIRTAEAAQRHALPRLIAAVGCPFVEIVREPDQLVLVLDIPRLVAALQDTAPELVVEQWYDR